MILLSAFFLQLANRKDYVNFPPVAPKATLTLGDNIVHQVVCDAVQVLCGYHMMFCYLCSCTGE
jgi:hypothetical protein